MLKVNADNEYKAVERVYSGSTEIDKILDKNGNVLFAVNKEVEGTPALTYTGKEETNLKNYRIYGNTVNGESVGDKTGNLFNVEVEQGSFNGSTGAEVSSNIRVRTTPLTITPNTFTINANGVDKVILLVYDGNTYLPNESVTGFKALPYNCTFSENRIVRFAFGKNDDSKITPSDISNIMLNSGSTALPYESYGYKVPVTVEGKNLCNNVWEQKIINVNTGNASPNGNTVCCDFIPVKPNVTYSCSRTIANNYNNLRCYGANKNYLGSGEVLANKANPLPQGASFGTFMITDARVSYIRFNDISNSLDTKYMLVEGVYTAETMPPYEPYHAPITTPVYLPEPIKIVGDEAEYIDYAEQKQYFADGTSTDVLLPALPTISGTNTLSVGTEVQPSKVEIKGKIKACR